MQELMQCELCGKEAQTKRILYQGMQLLACEECSALGTEIKQAAPKAHKVMIAREKELHETELEEGIASIIRKARQGKNLTIEELAKKIFEKDSLLRRIESGKLEPSDSVARRLERALEIKLLK